MFKKYSPDVLRLWALQQDFTKELKLSPQSMALTMERYRKLRNTLRFCLQNTADFDGVSVDAVKHPLNRLQLLTLRKLVVQVSQAAESFDFAGAVSALVQYAEGVSGDYFTAVKDELYCEAPNSERRREVQFVLAKLMATLTRLLVPVLPYTAEEAFQATGSATRGQESTSLLLTFSTLDLGEMGDDDELLTVFNALHQLKREAHQYVEAHRAEGVKGLAQLELSVSVPTGPAWVSSDLLRDYLGCAAVRVTQGSQYAVQVSVTTKHACPRCRQHVVDLQTLCQRCEEVEAGVLTA